MAPFNYAGYRNPYVQSIAALLAAPGQIEAQRAEQVGNAQARAAQQRGAAWGGAVQNIGGDIAGAIQAWQQQKQQAPINAAKLADATSQTAARDSETASRNQQTAARTQAGVDQTAIGHILATGGDRDAIIASIKGTPEERLIPDIQKSFDDAAKRKADFDKTVADTAKAGADAADTQNKITLSHADYLGGIAADIAKHGYDPTAFAHGVALAHKDGMIDTQTAGQAIAMGLQDPNSIKPFVDARVAASPEQQKMADARAKQSAVDANTTADNARATATADEAARHNRAMEARPAGGASGANGRLLTDSDADYVGTQYRILGPSGIPTRMGEADKAAAIHAANEQSKALGQSPVQAVQKQAAYKSDASSLTKMQNMKSSAEAFESKAIGQTDIIRGLSEKVGRTQSPLLNKWLLAGKSDIAGDKDTQLLFNAVTTFAAEYAKIMEGSTGSVAGSSEGARAAAERLISPRLNKGTMQGTLDLMQREMELTLQGYDATIAHITERMGGQQTPATNPPPVGGIPQGVTIQRN